MLQYERVNTRIKKPTYFINRNYGNGPVLLACRILLGALRRSIKHAQTDCLVCPAMVGAPRQYDTTRKHAVL